MTLAHGCLVGLWLALSAQVQDGRYGNVGQGSSEESATGDEAAAAFAASDSSATEQPPGNAHAASPIETTPSLAPPRTPELDPAFVAPIAAPPGSAVEGVGSTLLSIGQQAVGAAEDPHASTAAVAGPSPTDLMRTLLAVPETDQLPGVQVTLGEALRGAAGRRDQTLRAQAYWDLSAKVADYYLSLRERHEHEGLRQGVLSPGVVWEAAREQAESRVERARHSAAAAQLRLHELMSRSAGVSLPLPADSPHCGGYNTRIDEIFAAAPNPEAQQLDVLLPLLHDKLSAAAQDVGDAHGWLVFVSERRARESDGAELLRAYELWSARRREFIASAREYNVQIAAYTELATPEPVEVDRLVSMLIRVSTTADADAGQVRQASALEGQAGDGAEQRRAGSRTSSQGEGRMRTFADRLRYEARRPLARWLNREHSIVVSRLRGFDRGR